jgi:hypothetical protein
MSTVLLIRENPSRLFLPFVPDIQIEDRQRWAQEKLVDVMYMNKIIGRARLQYRVPFQAKNLKETQTLMVYNRLVPYVKNRFIKELGEAFTPESWLVYLLLKWEERDLIAFEQIYKEQWDDLIVTHPEQHQMQLAI